VVLQFVMPDVAVFAVFPPEDNAYDTRKYPFMFDALHAKATHQVSL